MFQAAVGKFVKSVCDDGALLAVPSLDAADDCRPLRVVVKKTRRWCWQKPTYSPQQFSLHDLLVPPNHLDVTVKPPRSYVTYNQTSKFSVSGDVGAGLKEVVDVKFSGSDTINVEAQFGDVEKVEVDEISLLESLKGRLLNFNHPLIQEIRQHPRKVLCVIMGTIVNKADSKLHMHATIDGKEVLNLTKTITKVADADIDSNISNDQDVGFKIPQDTPLAYNVYELLVNPGGQINVVLQRDCHGGFLDFDSIDGLTLDAAPVNGNEKGDTVDGKDTPDGCDEMHHIDPQERVKLIESILATCQFPQDIKPLLSVMMSGCEGCGGDPVSPDDLLELSQQLASPSTIYRQLLQNVGFRFQEDGSMEFPAKRTPPLSFTCDLFEALVQLDEDELQLVLQLGQQRAAQVSQLVKQSLAHQVLQLQDDKTKVDSETVALLKVLGFQQTANTLTPPGDKQQLEAVQYAMCSLWLTP